jgi:hypothetical protein
MFCALMSDDSLYGIQLQGVPLYTLIFSFSPGGYEWVSCKESNHSLRTLSVANKGLTLVSNHSLKCLGPTGPSLN